MARGVWIALALGLGAVAAYLVLWPVPIDPVAWTPPPAPGYQGAFARNDRLTAMERLPFGLHHGPEAVTLDAAGRIYTSTREGRIVRLRSDGSGAETYAETKGAPLGLRFDASGNLIVADALRGSHFANGVALADDESYVLVPETGSYRVLRHWLSGPRGGRTEPLIENLPGFPDNVTRGLGGRFWVALISPRSGPVDALAAHPFLRKILMRLPGVLLPQPSSYGHVVAFDATGKVVASLQDPSGGYRKISSALETAGYLYIGSLEMPELGRLARDRTGL